VLNYIRLVANIIRERIKSEVKDRKISLKLDIGARINKSVLGVNAQLYSKQVKKICSFYSLQKLSFTFIGEKISDVHFGDD
jgi:hypothetical protein